MHGTFPIERREQAFPATDLPSLCVCLAFATMPFVFATIVALVRFEGDLTLGDVLDVLRAATAAAPL